MVRTEAELAANLPPDLERAATLVRQRLHMGDAALQRRLREAYQGVVDARSLGIAKIPAVVVDRRYVIYGDPDAVRATARIETYRSARP